MGFFGPDYESAGAGIPKNAPKKKGIARFFELYIRKFWKLMEVNMLYSAFFIPLLLAVYAWFNLDDRKSSIVISISCLLIFAVLLGPATTGMMKILRNYFLEKHSFILSDFKTAFTDNFKKSLAFGLIDVLAATSVASSVYVYPKLAEVYGNSMMIFCVISISVGIAVMMMSFYVYLMIAATDLSFKEILKNSFVLSVIGLKKNLLTLFLTLIISALFVFLILKNLSTLFLMPFVPASTIAFIVCFNSYPVIQKYVINPYYEKIGAVNPEVEEESGAEAIFEDRGGFEKPVKKEKKTKKNQKKPKGKIIS